MAGANKPEPMKIIGGDGKTYVVGTWNRGTIADGKVMSDYTIKPICEAIQAGTSGLSAEIDRAIAAESGISAIVDNHYDEYNTFKESVIISAAELDEKISGVSAESLRYDNYLSAQIDTMKAATDVVDVVGTHAELLAYNENLTKNDVVKVLVDETKNYLEYYWRVVGDEPQKPYQWTEVGTITPYYSKTQIDDKERTLSSTIANNYLSASTAAVCSGLNIVVTKDPNNPKITIATKNEVDFDKVSATTAYGSSAKFTNISSTSLIALTATGNSAKFTNLSSQNLTTQNLTAQDLTSTNINATTTKSTNFSGNTLSGNTLYSTIDDLINSAKKGNAASAYITAHSADFLNSAHNAYGTLTFGNKAYPANNSSYNFTFIAGQGIDFITANNQVTISAEGTTYQGSTYISTANKTISVTNPLINSAYAGSAASAWVNNTLFDYSFYESSEPKTASGSIGQIKILYKNDADSHETMRNQEMVFKRGDCSVSGLLIQAAKNTDDGKVLTYSSGNNDYTWQEIPDSTYTNNDGYISINNLNRTIELATTGIKTSAYSAEFIDDGSHYNSVLNGESLNFSFGFSTLNISLTGVSYHGQGAQNSANWDNLFKNYAQVKRSPLSVRYGLTADKVNFVVATGSSGEHPYKVVNFIVTATLPSILDEDTYYIV